MPYTRAVSVDFEPKLMAVVGQDASRLHIGRGRERIADLRHPVGTVRAGPSCAIRRTVDGYSKMKSDMDWLKSRKDGLAAAETALNKAVATLAAGARADGSANH